MFLSDMATSTDNQARIALFQSIGLNEQKARETLKNNEVTRLLEATISEVRKPSFCSGFSLVRLFRRNNIYRRKIKFPKPLEIFSMLWQHEVNNKFIIYIGI